MKKPTAKMPKVARSAVVSFPGGKNWLEKKMAKEA